MYCCCIFFFFCPRFWREGGRDRGKERASERRTGSMGMIDGQRRYACPHLRSSRYPSSCYPQDYFTGIVIVITASPQLRRMFVSLREAVIILLQLTVFRALAFKRSANLQQAEDTLEVDAWAQRTRSGEGCVRLVCICSAPNFIKFNRIS